MNPILNAVGDGGLDGFGAFDLATTLTSTGTTLALVLGGATLAGIAVWQLGKGIDLALKRFSKTAAKS